MCDDRELAVMRVAELDLLSFLWRDRCEELPPGGFHVDAGYHYEPGLGAAIPNGYHYDPAAGVVVGPPRSTIVVRMSSGGGHENAGGGGYAPITQVPVVRVVDGGAPDPGKPAEGGGVSGVEPPYHPPQGTILETVAPPTTGWLRLGMTGLIHPTNTGNVAIIVTGIDAHGNTINPIILFPGDTVDWYKIDGPATDIATSIVYPPESTGPQPTDRAELTYVKPQNPTL
ncbi:hypothetical protein [Streptomyces afghaniensis]|uniref:hypothetical protein n=1 Tax=Streptomyces afghaniensis TaxID=66865 RepID=UPI0037AC22EA